MMSEHFSGPYGRQHLPFVATAIVLVLVEGLADTGTHVLAAVLIKLT